MARATFQNKVIYCVLLAGVALCTIQLLFNRSLWLDEATLALSIIHKTGWELFHPLDDHQVAPILFLQVEKLFSRLIPNSEFGLRLLPWLSFGLSSCFFYGILRQIFKESTVILFCLSLFVFNEILLYYSSEAKQYMCDVLALTSIYYFTLRSFSSRGHAYPALGATGVIMIFLSHVAPIILLSSAIYLLYLYFSRKAMVFKYLVYVFAVWALAFFIAYYFFIYQHPHQGFMLQYWLQADVFMPMNPFRPEWAVFMILKFKMIFRDLLNFGKISSYFLILFFLIGFIVLAKRQKVDSLLWVLPILIHLVLSALQLYPFELRLVLYLCPVIVVPIGYGIREVFQLIPSILPGNQFHWLSLLIPLCCLSILLYRPYPMQNEEVKACLHFIQESTNKEGDIYVYYGAEKAVLYYRSINYIQSSVRLIYGKDHRKNRQSYLDELMALHGKTWVLFSHTLENEETFILSQLDARGYRPLKSFSTKGASTYLFDFGWR